MTITQRPGTSDRWVEYLPLPDIQTASRNAKRHDKAGIAASVDRFGLGELPMLDERTGKLVAGHGRTEVLTQLHAQGSNPPAGVQVLDGQWRVPVLRGWSSADDAQAEAYGISSNQLVINGGWDQRELTAIVNDLAKLDMDLAGATGIQPADLDAILRAGDFHAQHAVAFLADDMATQIGSPGSPFEVGPSQVTSLGAGGVFASEFPTPVGNDEDAGGSAMSTSMAEHAAAPAGFPAPNEGQPYVQLAWSATVEQREIVRAAIRAAMDRQPGITQVEALVAVCTAYVGQEASA